MPSRPWLRTAFAAAWLAAQAVLIATAGARLQHSFGFRMFEESSTASLHVERIVEGGSLPVGLDWTAHDCRGAPHTYVWRRLVPFGPYQLDVPLNEPYGVDAAVARARAAVAWVATHTPDDCESSALDATVTPDTNGRAREPVRFTVRR